MLDLAKLLSGQQFARRGAAYELTKNSRDRSKIEDFLNSHGFTDVEIIGAGTNAFALRDAANPRLVIRISYDFPPEAGGGTERAVIPQTLQALFSKSFLDEDIPIKLEFLPYAPMTTDKSLHALFEAEITATGLRQAIGKCDTSDLGVLEYTERGTLKKIILAVDDSVFDTWESRDPRCTAHYPSLAVQQALHQELWQADERLQHLLPNGPVPLPETRIIPNLARHDRKLG